GTGATDNALFTIVGNSVRTNTLLNFELKNIYSIRVRVNDGFGGTFEKAFTIQVLDVNDAPNNIVLSNQSVSENRVANTIIGSMNTADEDISNTFTYSFEPISGNDNASFVISGNSLRTLAPLDFEAKNIYFVYIKTNDGAGGTFVKQFQISVLDSNDAPTNIILNSPSISENQAANSFIGTFLPVDQDATGSYIYSLISGTGSTDNASFYIRNDSLFNSQILNFELKNTHQIRVRCANSEQVFDKAIVLNVQNGNDAPTDILLSNVNVLENLSANSLIGSFSSIDEDTGEVHTYALIPGIGSTHNQKFTIVGNQLRTLESFNFEAQKTYSIRVLTNDGNGGTFSKAFNIFILDANDNPTQIAISNAMVTENLPVNAWVGNLSTVDEDSTDLHTYSFVNQGTNNNDQFLISNNQLRTNHSFDFESKSSYLVYVQTNDGRGGTFARQLLIQIKDTNDAPYGLSLDNAAIEENLPLRTFIGNFKTADYDATGSYTYSFVAGAGSAGNVRFLIAGDSLFSNILFDFESESQVSIRVRATDNGGLSFEQNFIIQILNKNDAPTTINLSNNTLTENLPNRSLVGLLSSVDQDVNNTFSYSLATGTGDTDNASFAILGNELRSNIRFNFESKSVYSIRLRTNDGFGGTLESAFTINIIDSADAPTNIILSNDNVTENRQLGTLIGVLNTIDEDVSDQFSYSFFQGASHNNDQFILVNNQLRTGKSFDFENKNFYIVYVRTTDNAGLSFVKQFVININDSNDVPTNLFLNNQSISENLPVKSFLGTLSTIDAETAINFTYSFVGGTGATDNALFSISNDSVYSNTSFNFELNPNLNIRIRTLDMGGAFFDKSFQIQVSDANDAPTDIQLNNNSIKENTPAGTQIGAFNALDEDGQETFVFSLASGSGDADNAAFTLIGSNLVSNSIFDFETKALYSIRVAVTDKLGATYEKIFVINVLDEIEAPTFGSDTFALSENSQIGFVIGNITANSPDANANLSYEWVSNMGLPFSLNAQTGDITLSQKIDYETQKFYEVQVKITDLRKPELAITRSIYIQVLDELEANQALPASNVISPDGDGFNDFFTIDNVDLYSDFALTIFNSSGVAVYKALNNYQNNWGGTYQDQILPKGVYFYVFSNKVTEFKGSITLIR
ncbi:MAG: cadherin domain-containing protein, partial [Bacteroidota bacterium]|nr:cadherin domain-containing protein [Bacteroidota bacterium]